MGVHQNSAWCRSSPDVLDKHKTIWADEATAGEQTALLIAHACGEGGSCAEYLRNTIIDLQTEEIQDRNLWRLQALVASEISRVHSA